MNISKAQIDNMAIACRAGLASLKRPVPMVVVEWANEHYYLPKESSYSPGRWGTLPFQVAIMNSMANDRIRVVNFIKSARVGYTKMVLAVMAYFVEHKARNCLMFQPTTWTVTGPATITANGGITIIGLVGTAPNASKGTVASRTTGTPLLENELTFNATEPGRQGNQYSVTAVAGVAEAETSASYAGGVLSIILGSDAEGVVTATAAEVVTAVKAVADSKIIAVESTAVGIVGPFSTLLAGGTDEPFPINTPVAVIGRTQLSALGAGGTLAEAITDITDQTNALIIVVRAADKAEGKSAAVLGARLPTLDMDSRASLIAAMAAWAQSESITNYRPRILIAPGFSEDDAIAKALETAANKLRAVAYVDCASMVTVQEAVTRRQMFGARVELLRPRVSKVKANGEIAFRPYSACAAGLRARIDVEKGWWWSKSNQPIANILGVEQVDEFILGDRNCQANLVNMENVSTIMRRDGFRHWGNRLCIKDPQWQFESVRRTADVIEDSIQETVLLYVDRPLDLENIDDILGTVNSYMRRLSKLKAIFGGRAWLDEELNTAETLAAGEVYIDYDFGPKSPTERITMRVRINNKYAVEELGTV